jgi:choline dehydrogenase-like flavoprotein
MTTEVTGEPGAAWAEEGADDDRPELDLLVWDAPNVDMTLSNVIGARPTPSSRPRFDAVARWLLASAGERDVEGTVFANVPAGGAVSMRGWIEAIRSFGYDVFARPKLGPDDDVDADTHVRRSARGFFLPTGTCALGSVVGERARVLGFEDLLVADASIMATIPRANTNLITAAIAEKVAETI